MVSHSNHARVFTFIRELQIDTLNFQDSSEPTTNRYGRLAAERRGTVCNTRAKACLATPEQSHYTRTLENREGRGQ